MMYLGEFLNSKFLASLNKTLVVMAVLFGLTVGALGIGAILERGRIGSMKDEIAAKSKAIVDVQEQAKIAKQKPAGERLPVGLAAVGAFQTKLNKIAADAHCAVTQFQASDTMNPFISTFSATAPPASVWTQVEVKINLQGTTPAIIGALKELHSTHIPYEFTSLELSRTQASATGEATVSANISMRVLTIPGGA
jgi:hypothetical protein